MNPDKNLQDPHGYAPEIREIEKEIIEFFAAKALEFTGRHIIISKVMTYFYIRKNLTQQELQKLTGFSAGTISKSVRQLLKMNIIAKEMVPGTHKHSYKMEKLPFISPRYFLRTESIMDEQILELEKMKKTLEANREEMENFEAYQKSCTTINQLLKLLPNVSGFIEEIEEELKKQKKMK
ncbi:MAG: hypothetical protein NWF06_02155 [Candidatus Bathyarchaeota archaeon]|nr:hypothetical protein [Candidatus Bathyarchaeum sp.]